MADRELRHMRRTELVEIIFALKQSEDQLKAENADLTAKLEQRQIHLDRPGISKRPPGRMAFLTGKEEKRSDSMKEWRMAKVNGR